MKKRNIPDEELNKISGGADYIQGPPPSGGTGGGGGGGTGIIPSTPPDDKSQVEGEDLGGDTGTMDQG